MTWFIELIANHSMELFTAITVVILYYYTRETYLLRKEAQRQTDVGFTPYLTIRSYEGTVNISNLGKGIAKEVHFEEIFVGKNRVSDIPTIGPDEKRGLQVHDVKESGYWSLSTHEAPDVIAITYKDLLGNVYSVEFSKNAEYQGGFIELSQRRMIKQKT